MALKSYSRPLDMLLASVAAYRRGKHKLASKLFVKACLSKSIREVLAELDKQNSVTARSAEDKRWMLMAKSIRDASVAERASVKKKAVKADEGEDDLGLEDLDLEADVVDDPDLGDDDADIDDLLDGLDDGDSDDTEFSESKDDDKEKKDDGEKAGEILPVSKSPDDPEYTHSETPKKDANEPATAKTAAIDKKAAAIAHNLKELSRLLNQ